MFFLFCHHTRSTFLLYSRRFTPYSHIFFPWRCSTGNYSGATVIMTTVSTQLSSCRCFTVPVHIFQLYSAFSILSDIQEMKQKPLLKDCPIMANKTIQVPGASVGVSQHWARCRVRYFTLCATVRLSTETWSSQVGANWRQFLVCNSEGKTGSTFFFNIYLVTVLSYGFALIWN